MSNIIRTVIDNKGKAWHYFDGCFWSITEFEGKTFMIGAAAMHDGNIEINVDWDEINAYDVAECEQRHVDFVNAVFGTTFVLYLDDESPNPVGTPSVIRPE
jgi:hypothetical protein